MEKFKSFVTSIREIIIILLLLSIIFFPSFVRGVFDNMGFTEIDFFGLKAKMEQEKNLKEATLTSSFEQDLTNYEDKIDSLNKIINTCEDNPQAKEIVADLNRDIAQSKENITQRNDVLKDQIMIQQDILQTKKKSVVPNTGWLYLGRVTEDKKRWYRGNPVNIVKGGPKFTSGETLTISQNAYLRKEGSELEQSKANIIAVIPKDSEVVFEDAKYSHAKAGGWFVWVKVRRKES